MGFVASPITEDLASFLQGLPPGAHVAVNLGGLGMEVALQISKKVAEARQERFVAIGHRNPIEEPAEISLGRAMPLTRFASADAPTWVVIEAAASVDAAGALEHGRAERHVGVEVSQRLTVVCFYTQDTINQVGARKFHDLHSVVAAPGQV